MVFQKQQVLNLDGIQVSIARGEKDAQGKVVCECLFDGDHLYIGTEPTESTDLIGQFDPVSQAVIAELVKNSLDIFGKEFSEEKIRSGYTGEELVFSSAKVISPIGSVSDYSPDKVYFGKRLLKFNGLVFQGPQFHAEFELVSVSELEQEPEPAIEASPVIEAAEQQVIPVPEPEPDFF